MEINDIYISVPIYQVNYNFPSQYLNMCRTLLKHYPAQIQLTLFIIVMKTIFFLTICTLKKNTHVL